MLQIATINALTGPVIGAAIEVHRRLGPGLLESVYLECLQIELQHCELAIETQVPIPLVYRDIPLHAYFRVDLLVQRQVVVEVKAVQHLTPLHEAQLITYLKLTGCPAGLLLNFNVPVLKDGIKRVLNTRPQVPGSAAPS